MGDLVARQGLVLADGYTDANTLQPGPFDKVDLNAFTGDALVQFLVDLAWRPRDGLPLRLGLFQSMPGLADTYGSAPTGIRFRRAVAGVASTIDVRIFTL